MYLYRTMSSTRYIQNIQHYTEVLNLVPSVKKTLWMGTADIKDLYVKRGLGTVPFLATIAGLIKSGVSVRLIHAKEPGPNFRKDFDKYPVLFKGLERMLCPRVHFKLFIFDNKIAYIGSANLTGAGLGYKSEDKRNFESGILTDEPGLVNAAAEQFDKVWIGIHCKKCLRKEFCGDRVV
jgi:phosphatidylserine/phosphatidylglycerophosphate/cardiolipin synthase-like enzyme